MKNQNSEKSENTKKKQQNPETLDNLQIQIITKFR